MLSTFSSNLISEEVECGECLCEIWKIKMRRLARVVCSPCSLLVLHPSAEHLQLQFDSKRGRVWWVSVWNMKDKDETIGESSMFTLFSFSASLKCWAPLAPIWFQERSSVVSVCVKYEIWKMRRLVRVVCSPCSVLVLHPSAEHLQL